VDQW